MPLQYSKLPSRMSPFTAPFVIEVMCQYAIGVGLSTDPRRRSPFSETNRPLVSLCSTKPLRPLARVIMHV